MKARIILVISIFFIIGLVLLDVRFQEPIYKGHSAVFWIKKGYIETPRPPEDYKTITWPEEVETKKAVRTIGSAAIPLYLRLIDVEADASLRVKIVMWLQSHRMAKFNFLGMDASLSHECGCIGLGILGADAKEAIPALKHFLDTGDADQKRSAAFALYNMGNVGISPLIEVISNHKSKGREIATCFLRFYADPSVSLSSEKLASTEEIDANAKVIVPFFIKCTHDEDSQVRDWAASGLGNFGRNPDVAVPALIQLVKNPSETLDTKIGALTALGEFTNNAVSAVPAIEEILRTGPTNLNLAALGALHSINAKP